MSLNIVGETSQFDLEITLETEDGSISIDADDTPTVVVLDGDEVQIDTIDSGDITNPEVGTYIAPWAPTQAGEFTIRWTYEVDGTEYTEDHDDYAFSVGATTQRTAVKEWVQRQLGYPTQCVELTDDHFDDAVTEAETWLMAHFAQTKSADLTLVSGQGEYDVESDCALVYDVAFPGVDTIMDVVGSESFLGLSGLPYSYMTTSGGGGMRLGPDVYQTYQYHEQLRRVLSNDRSWHYDQYAQTLHLSPLELTGTAKYYYVSDLVDYSKITKQRYWLLRRWALAWAKMVLGNMRSKYSEVAVAGGKVSMNGETLAGQAETEMADLNEKVKGLTPPMPFITG